MCSADKKTSQVHSNLRYRSYDLRALKYVLKGLKKHKYSQNRASNYDLQRNRLNGISVSRRAEIVLINLSGTLTYTRKLSSGNKRVAVYYNSPQKRAQQFKNPQVNSNSRYKLWFATKWAPAYQPVVKPI